ncbi:MAG: transglycosylase domain-containing protein [Actinomycetota bacterium]
MSSFRTRFLALVGAGALVTASCGPMSALSDQLEVLADLPRLEAKDLEFHPPETSEIFDANGRRITTLHGEENRDVVAFKRIPKRVWRAVLAIEDERFFEHDGIDLKAIARAAVANIDSGDASQGGSTITQQFVKNVIIAPNGGARKTLERKMNEAILARQIEERLTKEQILGRYLNTVYFGNGAYGIQAAAKTYFRRPVKRLSAKQAALLAGLIRSPVELDPYDRPKRAAARRDVVLNKMAELGWISDERKQRFLGTPLRIKEPKDARYKAPYFVDHVKRLLTFHPRFDFLGKNPRQRSKKLFEGGLRIETTIDLDMQRQAEDAVRSVLTERSDPHASLVSIDPNDGHIKAMVGGRDFFAKKKKDGFAKLNLAISAEPRLGRVRTLGDKVRRAPGSGRQAGSAFKPFTLAAALSSGDSITKTYPGPSCRTFPTADSGGPWEVCNYGDASYGNVTLFEATVKSINTVYAQLVLDSGPAKATKLARRMGIKTDLLAVPSAVLGTNPVNPLGMASAYGVFASGGMYRAPIAITRIVDASGEVIFKQKKRQRRVLDPAVAYVVTQALQQAIEGGTGTAARIGRPAAGKTGTAQEYRDAWFSGYTPDLVTAVWVGYPEGSISMRTSCSRADCRPTRIQVTGGSWPAQIWQLYMSKALSGIPATPFRPPDGLRRVVIDSRTGCLATSGTPPVYRTETVLLMDAPAPQPCITGSSGSSSGSAGTSASSGTSSGSGSGDGSQKGKEKKEKKGKGHGGD